MKRGLLTCGLLAGPVFVFTFLLNGALTADYDPARHPISSLSLAPHGWVQQANFFLTGALYTAFAAGLFRAVRSKVGPALIALLGLGLFVSGLFATDPVNGYPPGASGGDSTAGGLHDLAALPVFLGLPVAMLVFGFSFARARRWGWAGYSALSAVAFFALFTVAVDGFSGDDGYVAVGGLLQRASVIVGFAWLTAIAWHLRTMAGR